MTILANIQNLNLTFGEKVIFNDAQLTIAQNNHIGLIGLNGQGKSTLLKVLMGEVVPDTSTPPFIFDQKKNLQITYIPQEIDINDFPDLDCENFYLAFHPKLRKYHRELQKIENRLLTDYENEQLLHDQDDLIEKVNRLHGWSIAQNYESYLKLLNFNFEAKLKNLSGGELKKLSLASGLSSKADLVLWDEPTNHLDIDTIEKFEDEITNDPRAFVMISHDRYLLSNICDKILHIDQGSIHQFKGNYLEYLEYLDEKEAIRQKELDKAQNKHRRELAWMRQGVKARGTRSKKRVEGFHEIRSDIQELKSKSKKVVQLSMEHSGRKTKRLLSIEDGKFGYEDKAIFKNINIEIFKKDKIALVGLNGQGKTTLVNLITEKLKLTGGDFHCADQLKISVFGQNRDILNEQKTPFELIGDGQDFVHMPNGHSLHINSYLENFLFNSDQIRRPIKTLSGGEKNRLQLAMFMRKQSDLWIFDEPTNDLDIETIEVLEKMLKDYKNAVIIISHDRSFLDNTVNKSWVINNKEIETFQGGYTKIAPYLHALDLEKQIKEKEQQQSIKDEAHKKQDEDKKQRMNNKEKMRWDKIEKEIQQAEKELDHYTQQLASFDFNDMDDEKTQNYDELHNHQKKWEDELEKLYIEWEDLSSKTP